MRYNEELNLNCSNCQQQINWKGYIREYYSLTLNKNRIELCPGCWEIKKEDYKEFLKEEVLENTKTNYQKMGNINWQKLDKNDEQIVKYVLAFKIKNEKKNNGISYYGHEEISLCWGCDKWIENEKKHSNCEKIIAEKSELKAYEDRGRWYNLNDREKQSACA